jgi:hypothetical protein
LICESECGRKYKKWKEYILTNEVGIMAWSRSRAFHMVIKLVTCRPLLDNIALGS